MASFDLVITAFDCSCIFYSIRLSRLKWGDNLDLKNIQLEYNVLHGKRLLLHVNK